MKFTDSLRGYGHDVFLRDNFVCQYCGADGRRSFDIWLSLSVDHLLPVGHPQREEPAYKVTACRFCNEADNQYFAKAATAGYSFDQAPEVLLARRKAAVEKVRREYFRFWHSDVAMPEARKE